MTRVVLVTGVSRDLGAKFARTLAADDGFEVVGVDITPPRHELGRASFVRADIRNPIIVKVIAERAVETVVHMAMVATPSGAGGRSSMKEINVIGTMQLLAACQKADVLTKLVVQSSVSVYGASPRDPVKFTEEMSAQGAAADRLRQGRDRGRVLRPRSGPAAPRPGGDDAAAGQPDGGRGRQSGHPLPLTAGGAAGDGLRRAAPVPPSDRRGGRPARRDPQRSAGHLQRRGRGHADPVPGSEVDGPAVDRRPPTASRPWWRRRSARPGSATSPPTRSPP